MSDLLIKGLEMPSSCSECPLKTNPEEFYVGNGLFTKIYYCKITGNDIGNIKTTMKERAKECPLSEVEE